MASFCGSAGTGRWFSSNRWRRTSVAAAYGAGLRANTLVAAGAAMFVMLSALAVPPDDSFKRRPSCVGHWFPGSRGNSAKRTEHQRAQNCRNAVVFGGDWDALGLTDSSAVKTAAKLRPNFAGVTRGASTRLGKTELCTRSRNHVYDTTVRGLPPTPSTFQLPISS